MTPAISHQSGMSPDEMLTELHRKRVEAVERDALAEVIIFNECIRDLTKALLATDEHFCTSCKKTFKDGDTCPRGGCPMGGDL